MSSGWETPIKEELKMVEDEIRRNVQSRHELLTEIALHVINAGGKRIRPGVSLLAYNAVGGEDPSEIVGIAAAFEIIHSATLIHDDINDGGLTRRGRISAYKKYGVERALIAGDFLFVQGFKLGGILGETIVDLIADACTSMAESEILQSEWELDPDTPKEIYLEIIKGKTAKPIEVGAKTGAVLGDGTQDQVEAIGSYGMNLGYAFQIIDDVLDITGNNAKLGKPTGMDFLHGKPNLPLIMGVSNGTDGRIQELFKKRDKTSEEIEELLDMLCESGAVEDTRELAREYADRAVEALSEIPESIYKDAMISLSEVVIEREI